MQRQTAEIGTALRQANTGYLPASGQMNPPFWSLGQQFPSPSHNSYMLVVDTIGYCPSYEICVTLFVAYAENTKAP